VDCRCPDDLKGSQLQKFEAELVDVAKRFVRNAGDPVTAVVRFLQERPENTSLPGYLVATILSESFEGMENVPGIIKVLTAHVREIIRHPANVIDIINEHPAMERWGTYLIKQKDRIKFEVGLEKGKLALKNMSGLVAIEHGIELPLEKILIMPPKLEVTLRLGLLSPKRVVDIA
jgi:hypothetical protein